MAGLVTASSAACQPSDAVPTIERTVHAATGPARANTAGGALDPELTSYAYPYPVRMFEFRAQQQALRMAYLDVPAERPNGQTVLLLHGKNFTSAYWESTIRALNERGYRVIAPDQVGFGKSSKPAHYQFTFQALASNTRALLDAAGVGNVAVVGHSMGGMLAVRYARSYPATTVRLVLVNPIGLEDWQQTVAYRSIDVAYQEELAATPETLRAYQQKNYYGGKFKPDYERWLEVPVGWTKHPEYPRVAWCAARTSDMVFTQPVLYEFPNLNLPTLLIIGQQDRTAIGKAWAAPEVAAKLGDYPALGKRAARAIPNAKLVEIPEAGHLPHVQAFEAYRKALLGFLGTGEG